MEGTNRSLSAVYDFVPNQKELEVERHAIEKRASRLGVHALDDDWMEGLVLNIHTVLQVKRANPVHAFAELLYVKEKGKCEELLAVVEALFQVDSSLGGLDEQGKSAVLEFVHSAWNG